MTQDAAGGKRSFKKKNPNDGPRLSLGGRGIPRLGFALFRGASRSGLCTWGLLAVQIDTVARRMDGSWMGR